MSTTSTHNQLAVDENTRRIALDERLENFGWGVLLITIGAIWLAPEKQIPHGSWLIAAGLIMLGLNVIRYFCGIRMRGFSLVVGILALIAGLGAFFGLDVPLFPIALIVIGVYSLLKPVLGKHLFSASDQSWQCCGSKGQESDHDLHKAA